MFVVTDDGVMVIESINSQHSIGMLKAIKNITTKPVRYLLQSHNHWDFYNEWLPINVWNMMLQMEMGSFPWRPNYKAEAATSNVTP